MMTARRTAAQLCSRLARKTLNLAIRGSHWASVVVVAGRSAADCTSHLLVADAVSAGQV